MREVLTKIFHSALVRIALLLIPFLAFTLSNNWLGVYHMPIATLFGLSVATYVVRKILFPSFDMKRCIEVVMQNPIAAAIFALGVMIVVSVFAHETNQVLLAPYTANNNNAGNVTYVEQHADSVAHTVAADTSKKK